MRQAIQIFKKELRSYFVTPIAYIVIAIFLLVTGWFFFATFFLFGQASLRNFFSLLPIIFSFVIPAVTMRLVSEELNIGSYEILMTMPVTFTQVAGVNKPRAVRADLRTEYVLTASAVGPNCILCGGKIR